MATFSLLLRSLSFEERLSLLNKARKNIVDALTKVMSVDSPTLVAEFFAFSVETQINTLFAHDGRDKANYASKARTLLSALKNNKRIRNDVLVGKLAARDLVHLSAAGLASDERQQQIEQEKAEHAASRDSQWFLSNRASLLAESGIDPNAGGEFTCPKCKGNITAHTALQLDPGDEPMTVFVQCLTCQHRWKD